MATYRITAEFERPDDSTGTITPHVDLVTLLVEWCRTVRGNLKMYRVDCYDDASDVSSGDDAGCHDGDNLVSGDDAGGGIAHIHPHHHAGAPGFDCYDPTCGALTISPSTISPW